MNKIEIQQAGQKDKTWLFELYCTTMKYYIEKTWGWNDDFQKKAFEEGPLLPKKFQRVLVNDVPVGAYLVLDHADHYWLEMLLIQPRFQNKGFGTLIIQRLQTQSKKNAKAIKLCVIRINPAKTFYDGLGFRVFDEDTFFFKMLWKT